MKLYGDEMLLFTEGHCKNQENSLICQECPFEADDYNATVTRMCELEDDNTCNTDCRCVDCPFKPESKNLKEAML